MDDTCTCSWAHCPGYHRGETYLERIARRTSACKPYGHSAGMPTCDWLADEPTIPTQHFYSEETQ